MDKVIDSVTRLVQFANQAKKVNDKIEAALREFYNQKGVPFPEYRSSRNL